MAKGYAAGGDLFDEDEGPSAYSFSAADSGPRGLPHSRGLEIRAGRVAEEKIEV